MPKWLKEWGQFAALLAALGGFYSFIRSDMGAMEKRLGERIDGVEVLVRENAEDIARVREDIARVREDVAHLEGYVRGRLGDDLAPRVEDVEGR